MTSVRSVGLLYDTLMEGHAGPPGEELAVPIEDVCGGDSQSLKGLSSSTPVLTNVGPSHELIAHDDNVSALLFGWLFHSDLAHSSFAGLLMESLFMSMSCLFMYFHQHPDTILAVFTYCGKSSGQQAQ